MNPDPTSSLFDGFAGLLLRQILSTLWMLLTANWPIVLLLLGLLIVVKMHNLYCGFLRHVERLDRPQPRRRRW